MLNNRKKSVACHARPKVLNVETFSSGAKFICIESVVSQFRGHSILGFEGVFKQISNFQRTPIKQG